MLTYSFRSSLLLLILATWAVPASACSVPVFRYALEQWQPDAFEVVIFHEGDLTAEQNGLIEMLDPKALNAKYVGNVFVRKIDMSEAQDENWVKLWEAQDTKTLPWMLVLSPPKFGPALQVLAGPLNKANVQLVLSSPQRTEITKRLLKGDSVVWILIETGDKTKDDAAAEILETELARLQTELKLPEIDPADIKEGQLEDVEDALKIKFSLVRLSRDDPKEKAFLDMLLNAEPDLRDAEFASQPMAIPIFGRGRALYALIGKGIAQETIEDASVFLTGACQCTVKRQNPGVDLLTNVDWDSLVDATIKVDESTPTLTGLAGFGSQAAASNQEPIKQSGPLDDAGTKVDSANTEPAEKTDDLLEDISLAPKAKAIEAKLEMQKKTFSMSTWAIMIVGGLALLVVVVSLGYSPR